MKPVYVETFVRASMHELWEKTQRPELHQRWDLRFTSIDYLARAEPSHAQRFVYATRLGFGLAVHGEGVTVAKHGADGSRTSALRFWSADPKSLILEGRGYWRYVPTGEGVRFLTGYDYRTRFGFAGRVFDRLVFRPLIGWATAWSFDRLRLWLEQGIDPSDSRRRLLPRAGRCLRRPR